MLGVLVCICVCVLGAFACSHDCVLSVIAYFACVRAHIFFMFLAFKYFMYFRPCVFRVLFCLNGFILQKLNSKNSYIE